MHILLEDTNKDPVVVVHPQSVDVIVAPVHLHGRQLQQNKNGHIKGNPLPIHELLQVSLDFTVHIMPTLFIMFAKM